MNTYQFTYNNKTKTVVAPSYANAIEKASLILEDLNENLDLLKFDDWEDIKEECSQYKIKVSDLEEIYEC